MKRLIPLLAFIALPVLAQTSQPLVVVGGAIKTIPAGNGLQVPSMAGSGARCVQADALGTLTVAAGPCASGGSGSVTSVAVSGGTTGLTTTGGPITTSGTITLGGTLGVANGGTGSTTASAARTNLGVAIGSDVQAYSAKLGAYAGGDTPSAFTLGIVDSVDAAAWRSALGITGGTGTVTSVDASGGTTGLTFTGGPVTTSGTVTLGGTLGVANGGTGATTLTGYVKGSGTSALTASATVPGSDVSGDISGNAANVTGTVAVANGGTGSTTASTARTALGLGTIATQAASSVAITGGSVTGITDLAVADGGTGASTASAARTNLGLGTAATQNTGTSGTAVPLLDGGNTWSAQQTVNADIQAQNIVTGNNISTGAAVIELGNNRTGSGLSLIDFHSVAGTDYESRFMRDTGANGTLYIFNGGTGGIEVRSNGVTSMTINSAGNTTFGGTVSATNLLSGTYTPTLASVANVASASAYNAQYMRVGNSVTVSGKIDLTPTAGTTLTRVGISLPVASNLANQNELAGTGAEATNAVSYPGAMLGDATNDRAELNIYSATTTTRGIFFQFTYRVQ